MSTPSPLSPLNSYQENICTEGGTFGALLSVTCFIQHVVVTLSTWITQAMIPAYLFIIAAFILLAFQKSVSPILIIIGTAFSMVIEWIWLHDFAFSLVVLSLFLYHVALLVVLFVEGIPKKLKQKQQLKNEEDQQWAGKI